jgi:hypothetical protein
VFAPRVAYVLNYSSSGAKEIAEHKCSAKFSEAAATAVCMEKERKKFTADVVVFQKAEAGQPSFKIYRRTGNALAEMSSSKIALGEDTTDRLLMKVQDDKGWRSLFAGRKQLEVRRHDEYSIEFDDPQFGVLVYEARIGLIDQ